MFRQDLITIRNYIIGWVIAASFWGVVRNYGVSADDIEDISFQENVKLILLFAPIAGIFFGTVQIRFERYLLRRIPLWKLSILGILVNTLVTSVLLVMVYYFFRVVIEFNEPTSFWRFISHPNASLLFFYSILVNFTLTSLHQVNLLLGKGNLWKFIRGDFYSPRVERRVFMFVDLKGSTSIAESLGHIMYSKFLQDCFYDLRVVQSFDAEVYQYVGDEAVLSWRVKRKMDFSKCIKAFWAFQDQLEKRASNYQSKYGVVPQFKAGINLGEVTTAEVGEIKKEIAYHGDTMNIAARIQDKCNDFDESLLMSEFFHTQLTSDEAFEVRLMGEELLRGKNKTVKIFAINKKD